MFDVVNAQSKLLTLINATVSHEMRNPLNSIYSQNILQKQLNDKMKDIMHSKTITKQAIKKELSIIYKQYSESVDIQSTSTRLLNFLVNDMLDFASV